MGWVVLPACIAYVIGVVIALRKFYIRDWNAHILKRDAWKERRASFEPDFDLAATWYHAMLWPVPAFMYFANRTVFRPTPMELERTRQWEYEKARTILREAGCDCGAQDDFDHDVKCPLWIPAVRAYY